MARSLVVAVVSSSAVRVASGAALFARYAYAPNALGYCGPASADALAAGALAADAPGAGALRNPGAAQVPDGSDHDVRAAARRFSGAWPYLQVLARLAGIGDPLDQRIVESYWLGGGVNDQLDPHTFGAELLAVIGPQAGHYWSHLTPELLDEAAGDHCFHVFGVYPWSRLFGKGMDEQPLHVLDNCRIRWGTVLSRERDEIEVSSRRLSWDGAALGLAEPTVERIEGLGFVPDVEVGDQVALHWEWLTDLLDAEQVETLTTSTQRQLAATNRRIARVHR